MSELLSVDWLFAITLLLIWVGLMLAQGTKGKEIKKNPFSIVTVLS